MTCIMSEKEKGKLDDPLRVSVLERNPHKLGHAS